MNAINSAIGRSIPTSAAEAKVTGTSDFADDVRIKGMLFGLVLRSPHPRARIKHIDVSLARKVPGVITILTGRDFDQRYGAALMDQPIMACDTVRFAGEAVAAVAAINAVTAFEALNLVDVDYELLAGVFDGEAAMQPDAEPIHPQMHTYVTAPGIYPREGTNVCNYFRLRHGDFEKAIAKSAHVFTHTLSTQKTQHASLEPHVSTAQVDASGRIHVWSNTQTPFVTRKLLAKTFGLTTNQVRVSVERPGGGFGGKAYPKLEPLAVALALHAGHRPVRIVQTREEEFAGSTATRHPVKMKVTTGLESGGKFLARKTELIFDTGAYADIGPRVCRNAAFSSAGPYVIPNVKVDAYCVYTNTTPASAMRGLGIPQVTWGVESHTDMIAEALGLDPLQLRLQNAAEEGSVSATGQILHSVGLKETLIQAARSIDLDKPTPAGIGRGIACGHKSTVSPSASACVMRLNEDGTVQLLVSSVDMGQGSDVVLAQIAAEELGIEPQRVTIVQADTDVTPYDMATVSSRSTFFMGNAIRDAAAKIKKKIFSLAEELLEVDRRDLVLSQGRVHVLGSPSIGLDLHEIPQGESAYAGAAFSGRGEPLVTEGIYTIEDATLLDPETGQGAKPSVFWMYFSQAVKVSVDTETGKVRVLRVASAHDVGRAINPMLLEGQIEGACMMGIGEALYEEMTLTHGQVGNPSFLEYRIPTFMELPEIIPILVENPHREGPYGAKGMGEPALAAMAAAIGNAVFDAVGVRVTSLPITPEKILKALAKKKATV